MSQSLLFINQLAGLWPFHPTTKHIFKHGQHRLGKTHYNERSFWLAWVEVNERDGNKNTKQVLLLLFHPSRELAVFFRRTFKVHDGNVYVFVSFIRVWGACWSQSHRARPIHTSSIPAVAIKVILLEPRSRLFQCF